MSQIYRDPAVRYRDGNVPYRGTPPSIAGVDMERLDNIEVRIVGQDNTQYGQLPAATVENVSWDLYAPGAARVSLVSTDPSITELRPGERELQIIFNDCIRPDTGYPEMWWGIAAQEEDVPGTVTYDYESLEAWFGCRGIETASLEYSNIEQFNIGAALVQLAQTGANMDLNIGTYAPVASGILRYRKYQRDQHPYILDLLNEFPKLRNGFEWEVYVDPTGLRQWRPYYPYRGTHQLDYRFEYPEGNVVDYTRRRDFKGMRTRVYATGGSSGTVKFEQSYEDLNASARWKVRFGVVSDGTQKDLAWLQDMARQEVDLKKNPLADYTVIVRNRYFDANGNPKNLLGSLHPGDWVWLNIIDGNTEIVGENRIAGINWTPDDMLEFSFLKPENT